MSKMLFCKVCEAKVVIGAADTFNTDGDDFIGIYCDTCWFFVKRIQVLEERINDLEAANKLLLI